MAVKTGNTTKALRNAIATRDSGCYITRAWVARLPRLELASDNRWMDAIGTPLQKPRRRWFQVSLRAMLVLFALLSGALAFWNAQILPCRTIDATYNRLRARGAVEAGGIDRIELAWYQRPFLGTGWFSKCGSVVFRGEPSALDFDDLRAVLKDDLEVWVECPLSDSAAGQLAQMKIASLGVDLAGNLSHAGWEMLRGKPIRALSVRTYFNHANKFSGRDLQAISELPKLSSLAFEAYTLTDADFEFLKPIPSLESVAIRAHISDKALAFLAGAKLRSLFVEGESAKPVTGAGLIAIKDVERIELKTDGLTDASLAVITRWPSLSDLRLTFPKAISREGVKSLASAQHLQSLKLDFANITDADLPLIANCKGLKRLSLRGTKVTGAGLSALSALPLEQLDLAECPLTEAGADVIANMPGSFVVNVYARTPLESHEKLHDRLQHEIIPW